MARNNGQGVAGEKIVSLFDSDRRYDSLRSELLKVVLERGEKQELSLYGVLGVFQILREDLVRSFYAHAE